MCRDAFGPGFGSQGVCLFVVLPYRVRGIEMDVGGGDRRWI